MILFRRKHFFQVPFLLELSVTLALYTASSVTVAWAAECRDMDDSLSSWAQHLNNLSFTPTHHFPNTNIFRHRLHLECPAMAQGRSSETAGLHNVSLCPWIYVMDYDYDRFPHEMAYARCTCGRCSVTDPSGVHHQCRPLYHSFHVIRRVCEDNGAYRYTFSHESLPIACVCSHRQTHLVD